MEWKGRYIFQFTEPIEQRDMVAEWRHRSDGRIYGEVFFLGKWTPEYSEVHFQRYLNEAPKTEPVNAEEFMKHVEADWLSKGRI